MGRTRSQRAGVDVHAIRLLPPSLLAIPAYRKPTQAQLQSMMAATTSQKLFRDTGMASVGQSDSATPTHTAPLSSKVSSPPSTNRSLGDNQPANTPSSGELNVVVTEPAQSSSPYEYTSSSLAHMLRNPLEPSPANKPSNSTGLPLTPKESPHGTPRQRSMNMPLTPRSMYANADAMSTNAADASSKPQPIRLSSNSQSAWAGSARFAIMPTFSFAKSVEEIFADRVKSDPLLQRKLSLGLPVSTIAGSLHAPTKGNQSTAIALRMLLSAVDAAIYRACRQ